MCSYRLIYAIIFLSSLFPFFSYLYSDCPFAHNAQLYPTVAALKPIAKSSGSSFLTGDFASIQNDFVGFIHALWERYKEPIVELNIPFPQLLQRYFVVMSPDLAQAILLDKSGVFTKGAVEKRAEKFIFSPEGIIFMDANERWTMLNKKLLEGPLNPACFPNLYQEVFRNNFLWFIERLSNKDEPFELYQEMTYYTMRTMTEAFFNYTLEDDDLISITDAFAYIMNFTYQRETRVFNIPLKIPLPSHQKFYFYLNTFNTILENIIQKAPDVITIAGIKYPTMLGILKEHRDPGTDQHLTNTEIKSHVATIFFAAHDTTANFMTMLIYYLSTHSDLYKKLQQELLDAHEAHPFDWTPVGKLKHYTNFKNEILRLYPSLPVITIDTTQDVIVDKYLIPQKSVLCIGIEMINTHPHFFKNPHRFNPDRFDPENEDYTETTNGTIIPFNFGFRRCIGQWFAQAEAQSLIHNIILHNINFDLVEKNLPIGISMKMTGMPNRSIWVNPLKINRTNCIGHHTYAVQDVTMKIIDITYANEQQSIKTYRLGSLDDRALPCMYRPGDHIELTIETPEKNMIMRHFSISSSPTDSSHWLEVTIKNEEHGTLSSYLHNNAQVGDTVMVRAPLYDGVIISENDTPYRPLILISGGIGITPMISITRYLLAHNWPGDIYFIHSNKNKESTAFTTELIALADSHPNLHLIYTFTQSSDTIAGITCHSGRLNNTIFKSLGAEIMMNARIIVCGAEGMCDMLKKVLYTEYALDQEAIHYLSFGGTPKNDLTARTYTLAEVASHNTRSDAWLVIDNHVYDVTNYIAYHPGFDIILDYIGTDASTIFAKIPHSADAKKLLSNSSYITFKGFLRAQN